MADRIRGITLEIGGDTSGLTKALKDVNGNIKDTSKQLKDVERLLKLDPKNTELLAQKQQLLGQQITNTNQKLEELKNIQATMDQNGVDKNSEQYMALDREIIATENSLKDLKNQSKETSKAMAGITEVSKKVAEAAEKVAKGAQKVADKTRGISLAAGGALTALGGIAYKSMQTADELETLAQQTGFSTDELQKFKYASELVDVSMDDITGASKKLKKSMANNSKAFERIGVKTRDANGELRDSTTVFYEVLQGLSRISNETERDTVAMEIFGKSADDLAGIVDDGGKALKEYGDEAEKLGLIMSGDTIKSLNETNDEVDKLKATASATLAELGGKLLTTFAPTLERILTAVSNLLDYISNLDEGTLKMIGTVLLVIAAISPLASLISTISTMMVAMPTIIGAISTALTFLAANPIVLIIAAIVALVLLIATKGDEIQALLQKLDDWLQGIFTKDWTEIFGPVLGGALNMFFDNVKGIWDSIKMTFDGIIDFIRGVFTGDWERAWKGVKEIFGGIFKGLTAMLKAPLNGVITLINAAIDGINALISRVNSGIGSIFGFSIGTIGHIPYLAKGGVLDQGSAIVGEAGPELLTMARGKAVVQPLNTSHIEGLLGSIDGKMNGQGNMTIVVQSVLDGRVIGETAYNYTRDRAKQYGY